MYTKPIEVDGVAELASRPVTLGVVLLVVGAPLTCLFAPVGCYLFAQQTKLGDESRTALQQAQRLTESMDDLEKHVGELRSEHDNLRCVVEHLPSGQEAAALAAKCKRP